MKLPAFERFYGVDFSGAKQAGHNIWVAELVPTRRRPGLRLVALKSLAAHCGTAERAAALAHLVTMILASKRALWGFDFPFGLPVELFPAGTPWVNQFDFLHEWDGDAYACGLECVARARRLAAGLAHYRTALHLRRVTDVQARAPFDTFHYRLIYQTYFGMRDVVNPLRRSRDTAVLPFQYGRLETAKRVVVECCPSSVLKRCGVPHQNYKQPTGGPLAQKRLLRRHEILNWLSGWVAFDAGFRRTMMRNPGGDAMDAVIAAAGAAKAVAAADHRAIARHPRFRHEGHLYV